MKRIVLLAAMMGVLAAADDGPQYTADGRLVRPANYREWIYVSSGLGMTYGPAVKMAHDMNPSFDNVFVTRAAYQSFMETGKWPDKTMFVLEVRAAESKGSINHGGHFQGGLGGIEVEVKDESRFPGKWAFFGFEKSMAPAKALAPSADCYSCHAAHGALDNTFVQFYPTLLPVARAKGTLQEK